MQNSSCKSRFSFNCLHPSGTIPHGKHTEAVFTFSPQSFGTFETFYTFEVPQHNLTTSFLLFGVARKPKIHFEKPHINLKPGVLGIEITEEIKLKNDDSVSCHYKIHRESLFSPSKEQSLSIEPLSGELQPHSCDVLR